MQRCLYLSSALHFEVFEADDDLYMYLHGCQEGSSESDRKKCLAFA